MSQSKYGKSNEDKSFQEDRGQRSLVWDVSGTVVSNDVVSEVSVQSHTRSDGNWHVGEESHSDTAQSRDGSSSSDKISVDLLNTEHIRRIAIAYIGRIGIVAFASTSRLGDDACVDRDDVCHGEEGSESSSDLREEVSTLSFLGLDDRICQS